MEKIGESQVTLNVLNLQLFSDDLASIGEILSHNGRQLTLVLDDWKLNPAELAGFHEQTVAKQLVCVSTCVGSSAGAIYITISGGKAFIEIYETTPEAEGLLFRLQKVFERATVPGADPKRWLWHNEQWDTIVLSRRPTSPPKIASFAPPATSAAGSSNTDVQQAVKPPSTSPKETTKQSVRHELKLHVAKTAIQQIMMWVSAAIGAAALGVFGWIVSKFHRLR